MHAIDLEPQVTRIPHASQESRKQSSYAAVIFYRKGHSHCFLDNNSICKGNFWHFQWMQTDQHQRKLNRHGEPVPSTKGLHYLTFGIFYMPNVPTLNAVLSSSYSAHVNQGTAKKRRGTEVSLIYENVLHSGNYWKLTSES